MKVYLDNTASTPLLPEVIDAMKNAMENLYANPSSVHYHGRMSKVVIENARKTIASNLNCVPSEIIFTSGGTEANNMAIYGCIYDLGVQNVITSKIEHHAILHTLEHFEQKGLIKIHFVELNEKGQINLDSLEKHLIDFPNALVTLMYANNEISNRLPVRKVSKLCRKYDALFHSDMVQSIGHYHIDLQNIDIDFASSSGHKFHAPKGIGFIYINSKKVKIDALIHGGGQERNMRGGTENIYGIAGLAKAFEIAHEKMDEDMTYIADLKQYMIQQIIENFDNVSFIGESANTGLYTVLSVNFPKAMFDDMLLMNLDIEGVSASSGSACTSGALKGSHVIKELKIPAENQVIRFSFSKLNTKSDINFCINVLKKLQKNKG